MNLNILNIQKKRKKYYEFYLNIPPQRKKPNNNDYYQKIQSLFIDEMKKYHGKSLTGNIAVQILVFSSSERIPSIQSYVKNIVDIMHKPIYLNNKMDAQYLPFQDDKQIKYLYAQYNYMKEGDSIYISIRPFSSFISDLHFSKEFIDTGKKDEIQSYPLLNSFIENKGSQQVIDSWKKHETYLEQKSFGKLISLSPFMIKLLYPQHGRKEAHFNSNKHFIDLLTNENNAILKLPGIPTGTKDQDTTKVEKKNYKYEIKKIISEYILSIDFLREIQAPIIITVIYWPSKKEFRRKDIDNIMLEYIVPTINGLFNPPSTMFRRIDDCANMSQLKNANGMIVGYEIIKAPKEIFQNHDGGLIIGYKFTDEDTLLNRLDSFIDEYVENNK